MRKMSLKLKNEKELMKEIKRKHYEKTGGIFLACEEFIKSRYISCSVAEYKISLGDFKSECYLVILECMRNHKNGGAEGLIKLIRKTIYKRAISIVEGYEKYCDRNVIGKFDDNSSYIESCDEACVELDIVNKLTVESCYRQYGDEKITEYEIETFKEYICTGDLMDFAKSRGIKYQSAMRTLKRVIEKIRKITSSLGISTTEILGRNLLSELEKIDIRKRKKCL